MRTLVSILLYIGIVGTPLGTIAVLVTVVWGKITGRPPAGLLDDIRLSDIVATVGMGIAMISMMLWVMGVGLALAFVTPSLLELLHFISGLFGI